jgi:hypothetical protein
MALERNPRDTARFFFFFFGMKGLDNIAEIISNERLWRWNGLSEEEDDDKVR